MATQMVNVRFNESTVLATRTFAAGETHVVTQEDADRLGSSVEVLGPAPIDFPSYDESVYGDNEAAHAREPQDPADVEPVAVGEDNPNEPAEVTGAEGQPQNDEYREELTKDAEAPDNKMVSSAPKKKSGGSK